MARYSKGANAERELIRELWNKGFAVTRTAGSGSTPLPAPDLVALGKEKKLAFECKAWKSSYLSLDIAQMEEQLEWCERADAELYIAWKIPHEGWLFLHPKHFNKTPKFYYISRKNANKNAVKLEVILGQQATLK